jgi:hypothetical protein
VPFWQGLGCHFGKALDRWDLSVFDSLINIAIIAKGGNFLRKLPLDIFHSVKSRIENAVAGPAPAWRCIAEIPKMLYGRWCDSPDPAEGVSYPGRKFVHGLNGLYPAPCGNSVGAASGCSPGSRVESANAIYNRFLVSISHIAHR